MERCAGLRHEVVKTRVPCLQAGQVEPEACAGANQSGTAHRHVTDGVAHVVHRAQVPHFEGVWQALLIDHLHHPLVTRLEPDGAVGVAAYLHFNQPRLRKYHIGTSALATITASA